MKLSIVFGTAYEVAEPLDGNVRNYNAGGRHFIGHDSSDIVHVCDEACAQTVITEAGPYVKCEDTDAYVIVPDVPYDPSEMFRNVPTADIHGFDPGDDPYILCGACETELLRDEDKFYEQYGRHIGERS